MTIYRWTCPECGLVIRVVGDDPNHKACVCGTPQDVEVESE